jgi:hypothetical protein
MASGTDVLSSKPDRKHGIRIIRRSDTPRQILLRLAWASLRTLAAPLEIAGNAEAADAGTCMVASKRSTEHLPPAKYHAYGLISTSKSIWKKIA